MKSFLLTVFMLHQVSVEHADDIVKVSGCPGGWVEFTWTNPEYSSGEITVDTPGRGTTTLEENQLEEKVSNNWFLYKNINDNSLSMMVRPIKEKDFGKYECSLNDKIFKLKGDPAVCLESEQTIYTTTEIRINCSQPDVNFICKESDISCDMLSSESLYGYLTSDVTPEDNGIYWCGYESLSDESSDNGYKVSREKIRLQVFTQTTTQSTFLTTTSVTPPTTTTVSTTPTSSSPATSVRPPTTPSQGDLWKTLIIVFSVCGVAAVLGFVAFFLNKRRRSSKSTKPDREEPENKKENQYEEIQDRPPPPGSRPAIKTSYAVSTLSSAEDSAGPCTTDTTSITPSTTDGTNITLSTTDTTSITPSTTDTTSMTPSGADTTSITPTPSASTTTIVYSSVISLLSETTERTQKSLNTDATSDVKPATSVIYSAVKDQVKL